MDYCHMLVVGSILMCTQITQDIIVYGYLIQHLSAKM